MCALLLSATLALGAVVVAPADEDAWLARLSLPDLARYDFEYTVDPYSLGLVDGFDLGFPDDPELRVRDAERRFVSEGRTARLLHQAVSGHVFLRDVERAAGLLPECLEVYAAEVEASPEDLALRMSFARALELALMLTRDPRPVQDARAQLAVAARLAPDDWLVPFADANVCAMGLIAFDFEGELCGELEAGVVAGVDRAKALAPDRVEPAWLTLYLALVQGMSGVGESTSPEEVAACMREFEVAVNGFQSSFEGQAPMEGAAAFQLVAEGYWILGRMIRLQFADLSATERAELRAHVRAVYDQLDVVRIDEYHAARLASIAWLALTFLGLDAESPALLERAVGHGMGRELALGSALKRFRGEREVAEAFAAELEEGEPSHIARGALVMYRCGTGELERARAVIAGMTPRAETRAADAIVALRLGERKDARRALTALLLETGGDGVTRHALGVALALDGRWELAIEQLEAALPLLEEPEDARSTLEEVRQRALADLK